MEQRLNLITLAVADLARARHFYEVGLGWTPVQAEESIIFYKLGGLILSLFPREQLREDAKQGPEWEQGGFTLAQNFAERAGGRDDRAGGRGGRDPAEGTGGHRVGRLLRLRRRPRRPSLGDRLADAGNVEVGE